MVQPPDITPRDILSHGIELLVERRVKLTVSYEVFAKCLRLENHLWQSLIDPIKDSIR